MESAITIWMGGFDDGRTPGVQQYDAKTRKYRCMLMEKPGQPYMMADDAIVGAVYKWRGSPASHEYETEVLDRSTVRVTVPTAAMLRPGYVEMQLKFHQDGGLLNGPVICFIVNESLDAADEETDEPALLLEELVKEAQNATMFAQQGANNAASAAKQANAAAGGATTAANSARNAASAAESAANDVQKAKQLAEQEAAHANAEAQNARQKAQEAAGAAEAAYGGAGAAMAAAGEAMEAKTEADAATRNTLNAIKEANYAAEDARNAAEKIGNINVDVEMLSPDAEASAAVTERETGMDILLKIPKSNVAYATFYVDDGMYLIMNTPSGFDGISFQLNADGDLEVEIG